MKHSRFIELLNLYVDQELSPADAAELESEIARNPARRRTYEQYCRMHRACVVLFEKESAPVPSFSKLVAAARAAEEKVVAFPGAALAEGGGSVAAARPWGRSLWAAGVVAAAACVAVVVMRQVPTELAGPAPTITTGSVVANVEPTANMVRSIEEPVMIPQPVAPKRSEYQSVLVTHTLLRTPESSHDASLAFSTDRSSLEWMERVQLSPLQDVSTEDFRFEVRPLQTPDSRTYRGRNSYPTNVEMTAFTFQR